MIPGMNPSQMKAIMKQMGIKQEEIDALRVIIQKEEENIIIENPSIIKVNMQGSESFQISGDVRTENKEKFSEEDVRIVIEKTGVSESDARKSLEKHNGDLSEAIIELS
jgi:nascent polypeptide-associated complex subunit alpha